MKNYLESTIRMFYKRIVPFLLVFAVFMSSGLYVKASSVIVDTKSTVTVERGVRAMAEELVKEKGWDKLPNSEVFVDCFARMASVNNVMTPKEVIDSIRSKVKGIELIPEDRLEDAHTTEDGYIYVNRSDITYGLVMHETTHAISITNDQFPFWASKFPTLEGNNNNNIFFQHNLFLEGLTDLFALRGVPEHCWTQVASYSFEPEGTINAWATSCEHSSYNESGVVVSFLYAAGSTEVERAFYINEEGNRFKGNFDRINGDGTFENIISLVDEWSAYTQLSLREQENGIARRGLINTTKEYITDTVSIMENRLKHISYSEEAKDFLSDLKMYKEYGIKVSDQVFTQSINEKLDLLESKAEKAVTELPSYMVQVPKVTFDALNGNSTTIQVPYDSRPDKPSIPTREGYNFEGWYSDPQCTAFPWDFQNDRVKGNMTLYAKWVPDKDYSICKVSFDTQDGSRPKEIEVFHGYTIRHTETPKRAGYIFVGWYTEPECINPWNFVSGIVSWDMTLYARWEKVSTNGKCNLYINNQDGNITTVRDCDCGSGILMPRVSNIPGRGIDEWYSGEEFKNRWDFGKDVITGDITLFADWWVDNSLTVVFDTQDGGKVTLYDTPHGSPLNPPPIPRKPGLAIEGWYKEPQCIHPWNFSFDCVTSDTTLYAKWEKLSYSISPLDNVTLKPIKQGYRKGTQEIETVTITSTGTGDLKNLKVTLSGANADKFILTQPESTTLDDDTPYTDFTIKAKDGLKAGTYKATVTVKADNMTSKSFVVTQVVNK